MLRLFEKSLLWLLLPTTSLLGMTFDFRTPDSFNALKISVVTSFGSGELKGELRGARGKLELNPLNLAASQGTLFFDARGIRLFYPKSQVDVHTSTWLDTNRFPHISFKLNGIRKIRWRGQEINCEIFGILTLKGRSKEILLPAKIRYSRAERRALDGRVGDLIKVETELSILRGEFGINPGGMLDQVANEISVGITLLGHSDRVRPLLPSKLFRNP